MATRRSFLFGSTSLLAVSALGSGISLMSSSPTRAEPITVAIAAASAIAGFLGSGGGNAVGAYLQALTQKLDIAIGQLDSIQRAVADLIVAVSRTEDIVEQKLRQAEIRNLQEQTFAVMQTYTHLIAVRLRNYRSDKEFMAVENYRLDVQNCLERLTTATSQLWAKNALDAATVYALRIAYPLHLALLSLRGDPGRDIAVALGPYRDWFVLIGDERIIGSAAEYRNSALARHEAYMAGAKKLPLAAAIGMKSGVAQVACVGLDDYSEAEYIPNIDPDVLRTPEPDTKPFASPLADGALPYSAPTMSNWRGMGETIPERIGNKDRLYVNAELVERPKISRLIMNNVEQDLPAGFNELVLSLKKPPVRTLAGDAAITITCDVETFDLRANPMDVAVRLDNRLSKSAGMIDFSSLSQYVDKINDERARVAFATFSLSAAVEASTDIKNIISRLEAGR